MDESREQLYKRCHQKLLKTKEELLNGLSALDSSLSTQINGDEGDMAQALEDQHKSLAQRDRYYQQIREIDHALERIEEGTYGICEETEEPIESDRLEAIPWTRLSLEGAEIREQRRKRFA